ncbi:unnamed protein product [Trichogramma brassicae]|uniref:Ionotropic glutamate receptor L-glutamate and glycine-binding domain-containing protein n=1 Tax=Trichogramma brassicae TaxID=86971 RepID=A0A6H5IGJ2_9HYME|nr:unnamed protein product [Trichogramma brassicae]
MNDATFERDRNFPDEKFVECNDRRYDREHAGKISVGGSCLRVTRDALDARLYSSRFSTLQIFTCGRVENEQQRLLLLRGLATSFLGPIRSIGADEFVNRSSRVEEQHRLTLESHRSLFILDLDCSDDMIERLVEAADAGRLFSTPYKWLLITQNQNVSSFSRLLASRDIYPSSDVVVVSSRAGRVVSVYRTSKESGELLIEDRAHWDRGGRALSLLGDVVAWRRRKNLRGTALKSSLVITNKDTINHLTDYQDKHIDTITKSNYPWALLFVQMFNATVSFDRVGTWGYLSANGSWGGMIGQLQRGEIDFGGTGTFLVGQRIGVVQYISLTTTSQCAYTYLMTIAVNTMKKLSIFVQLSVRVSPAAPFIDLESVSSAVRPVGLARSSGPAPAARRPAVPGHEARVAEHRPRQARVAERAESAEPERRPDRRPRGRLAARFLVRAPIDPHPPNLPHGPARRPESLRGLRGQHSRAPPVDHLVHQRSARPASQSADLSRPRHRLQSTLLRLVQGSREAQRLRGQDLQRSGSIGLVEKVQQLVRHRGGHRARQAGPVRVSRGPRRRLQDRPGDLRRGREVRLSRDRLSESVRSAFRDTGEVALRRALQSRVRIHYTYANEKRKCTYELTLLFVIAIRWLFQLTSFFASRPRTQGIETARDGTARPRARSSVRQTAELRLVPSLPQRRTDRVLRGLLSARLRRYTGDRYALPRDRHRPALAHISTGSANIV